MIVIESKKKSINLALQGGGAHGAYTWGILDKLLEEDEFEIVGISATSAGSMNAVVLAQGLMEGGNERARELLISFLAGDERMWRTYWIDGTTAYGYILQPFLKVPMSFYYFNAVTNLLSPYQFNPFNYHPITRCIGKNDRH